MITRRELLQQGAAAGLAAGLAGLAACRRDPGRFDVCVIGSGFAGVHLALRTARAGLATAVVEAGSALGSEGGLADVFECATAGVTYPVDRSRIIAVGGTSNHWTGSLNRLRESDFRVRSEFGLYSDWPIGYEDLAAPYCEAERLLWATGGPPVAGAEPARDCAYPFAHEPKDAPYRPPALSFRGRDVAFFPVARSKQGGRGGVVRLAQSDIPGLIDLPETTWLPGRMATRLVSQDGRRIDHVVVRTADGGEERIHARHFVVASGVLESARLLLLSRSSGFPEGLGNASGLVGRYFVAHPTFMWSVPVEAPASLPPGVHRTYHFNDRLRARELNACHYQLHVEQPGRVVWKAQPEMEPRARNRIVLSRRRRDRFGLPLPVLRFKPSPRDLRTARASLPFVHEQLRALGVNPRLMPRSRRWRYHPAGTCRMGADEKSGVVDRDGRVFGTENVYVSGAAVFPNSGTSNPTLSVVALTLRLADHLISRG